MTEKVTESKRVFALRGCFAIRGYFHMSLVDLDHAEKAAICAARSAGDLLRKYWAKDGQKVSAEFIEFKSVTDLVTKADKEAEELIMRCLRSFTPSFSFLCEESGASTSDSAVDVPRWIVDPLDGTTSFAHGHPHFSVSICLEVGGSAVLVRRRPFWFWVWFYHSIEYSTECAHVFFFFIFVCFVCLFIF